MTPQSEKAIHMLKELQPEVGKEINRYFTQQLEEIKKKYSRHSILPIEILHDISTRGAKRLRAAFVYYGYQMLGGTDLNAAMKLASIIEIVHAYLLVIDDFMDMSDQRRGGSTAHKILEKHHIDQNYKYNASHFGNSIAVNVGIAGSHMAMQWLSELDIDVEKRVAISQNLNMMLVVTAHGQINDVINAYIPEVTEADVINVLKWKTAAYTYENPLHTGAILAGASQEDLNTLSQFATWGGVAFQVKDDILGTFGETDVTGKSDMDDMKEGKMTLLTVKALEKASPAQKETLTKALGNYELTDELHNDAKQIILETGALAFSEQIAQQYTERALKELSAGKKDYWNEDFYDFIAGICDYVLKRKS